MIFAAFISIMLALNFLAGALSHAIAPRRPGSRAEIVATGFVAGVALLLTEVLVLGAREAAVVLDPSSAAGTGGDILLIHLLFVLMLAILVLPASFINGLVAAAGSIWYNELKHRAELEDL
jgi:hypothetical protein